MRDNFEIWIYNGLSCCFVSRLRFSSFPFKSLLAGLAHGWISAVDPNKKTIPPRVMTKAARRKTILHAVVNSITGGSADAEAVKAPMISGATKPGMVAKVLEMPVIIPA